MVLHGKLIQRCDPAWCTFRINRLLLNEIAWLLCDRRHVRAKSGAHACQRIVHFERAEQAMCEWVLRHSFQTACAS